MKNIVRIISLLLLVCFCLTACEAWQDEEGTVHFMLCGERGAMKDGEPLSEEEIASIEK